MEPKDYRLAAVVFTDIVGFSRMMEEDEKGTLVTLDFHNRLVREQVERFRGTVIKTIGDAFLAQFSTTLDAVQCSLAVQQGIREYNDAKLGKPLTLRIGVHLGDIYFYENDALGEGINIASRLQSLTKPGHITISREVYSQVSGKIPMKVEAMGQVHLKNITREVHAYEIIPGGEDNNSSAYLKAHRVETPAPEPEAAPARPAPATPARGPSPAAPAPAFRDMRDEWRSLRDQIKAQVKSDLAGGPERWHEVKHDVRRHLRHARREALNGGAAAFVSQILSDPLDELKNGDGTPATAFQIYKQKVLRKSEKMGAGFKGHLIPFLMVNAFLGWINLTYSPSFLWFLFPLFGWGVGLFSHAAAVRAAKRSAREVLQVEELGDEELNVLKKYQDARAGVFGHVVSNAAVSVLLLVIWSISGAGFPWPLIPIAAMAVGVFSHLGSFVSRRSQFKALWKRITRGAPAARPKAVPAEPEADPLVRKAKGLRDSILAQARDFKGGNPLGEDLPVTLDNYVLQITELSAIEQELARVVTSFNLAELDAEEASLRGKVAATASATLKHEYEKSLSEVGLQRKSFSDLAEQQELLSLRIKSALGNLQQMQVDLARIKGLSDGQKQGAFVSIKDKSEELSRYLEDYREGLKEIPD
jgi:class 3 adenylate cyclase